MLKLVSATDSLLLIVTVWAALAVPTANVVLNAMELGETETGAMAVPCTARDTVSTVPSVTVMVPVCCPVTKGIAVEGV
jgi:hypothetical protein